MTTEPTPGLDVATALKRLGGNVKLYTRLLDQFQNTYAGAGEEMAALLAASDITAAERAAHTLKGLAGNLGADNLQHSAAEMERLCRENNNRSAMEASLALCGADLADALTAVRAYLAAAAQNAPASAAAPAPLGPAVLLPKVENLLKLLRDDDASADAQFRQIRASLETIDRVLVQTLAASIEAFDFSTAVDLVEALRDRLRSRAADHRNM